MAIWYDTGSTATTNNTIWSYWTGTQTTAATNITTQVWYTWNQHNAQGVSQLTGQQMAQQYAPHAQSPLSEEERAEMAARLAEEKRLREEAEARAEKLLVENLSLRQREQYAKDKHFIVERGDRRYRIRRGRQGNVDVIDKNGCVEHRLCAHPNESVPDFDTMLAQKLMLEHDDEAFRKVANWHGSHDRTTPVLPALH